MGKEGALYLWVDSIFEKWFKNIIILIVLIPAIIILDVGVIRGWIDSTFALEMFYLIVGILIGRWLENGKK